MKDLRILAPNVNAVLNLYETVENTQTGVNYIKRRFSMKDNIIEELLIIGILVFIFMTGYYVGTIEEDKVSKFCIQEVK